jgi:membrane protein implicated in regulation of membrane protease activity
MGFISILAAIPGFFLSSLFFMLLWGVIAPKLGLNKIDYPTAMLITITLWIAVAPLAAAAGRRVRREQQNDLS